MEPSKKRRKALNDADRLMIRKRNKTYPLVHQNDLALWFTQETGHEINQGMISKILSKAYDHLDSLDRKKDKAVLQGKRSSRGDWPDLEAALFEWQQRMENKKATVTRDILKEKATKIWQALPQYEGIEEPKWSNGWLQGFKSRYKIKEYVQHGEGGTAAIDDPDNIIQMNELRLLCEDYKDCDILNMDEIALYWKMAPDRTLATKAQAGGKKSKDRITIALTSNADGSETFKPWIIGKSKNPRCFKNINRQHLRITYRYNKTKWMTGLIYKEYL